MAYVTSQTYKDVIYSGNAQQRLRLWVNNTEIDDIDEYCEQITINKRVFPNGTETFNINNLISQEVEITVHNLLESTFDGEITFEIGTLVDETNDTYEYVPMGVFNVQETSMSDNDTLTITLRDNSVKLDVPYNAKPLIDDNGGFATLKQILDDICDTCNITSNVTTFNGDDKLIGIYDNTINARTYVNYIAGQCGAIPIINRDGELDFVYTNSLTTHKIPLSVVESYKLGKPFTISKVKFESGALMYEAGTDTNDTMFLDSSNVYINNQDVIDYVYSIMNGFGIDSVETGNILGDPAVDPYDIIEIYGYYDNNDDFVPDENTVVFRTFANQKLTYSGVSTAQYDTQISDDKRETNVSLTSNATYKKNVKSEIDLINGTLKFINDEYLDLWDEKSGTGYVEVENIYTNGIIKLEIMGTMSMLFPQNNLYPSDSIYPLSTELVIEDSSHNKKYYDLNINYLASGDKYVYTYEYKDTEKTYMPKAKIIRANNTEIELEAPLFDLPKGNYKIYMRYFNNLQYNVQYVIENELTGTLATNVQVSTAITQTKNAIDLQATQKVNKDDIIADLNVAIKDGKGVISLTGNQVVIESDNFKLNGDGTLNAKNGVFEGTINGSSIIGSKLKILDDIRASSTQQLYDDPSFLLTSYETYDESDHQYNSYLSGGMIDMQDDMGGYVKLTTGMGFGEIKCKGTVWAKSFEKLCLENEKKDFEKFNNALKIIKNTDIYKYRYKNNGDNTKKDIGIVIGERYKYSKELTNDENNAVNLANMVGVCFQAIKEQQKMIENLQKEINKLKEAK